MAKVANKKLLFMNNFSFCNKLLKIRLLQGASVNVCMWERVDKSAILSCVFLGVSRHLLYIVALYKGKQSALIVVKQTLQTSGKVGSDPSSFARRNMHAFRSLESVHKNDGIIPELH